MAEYAYKLSNGKELILNGDIAPTDDEVESIAKEQGVTLALANEEVKTDFSKVESGSSSNDKIGMRKKLGYGRQDEQTFDLDKFLEGTNEITNNISNRIGQSDFIPEGAKRTLATGAALIPEMGNVLASIFADPTTAATSTGVARSLAHRIPTPESIPMIPPTVASNVQRNPIALLSEHAGIREPGFIGGEAGMAINKPYPIDLGPLSYPSQVNSPDIMADAVSQMRDPVTVLPREVEGINMIPPSLAAESGTSIGRPSNILPPLFGGSLERVPGSSVYTGTGHARPDQSQLPSAVVKLRERVIKEQAKVLETQNVPTPVAKVAAEIIVKDPILAPIIQDQGFIKKYLTAFSKRQTPGSRLTAGLVSSVDSELDNQLPRLGMLVKQTQADSHIKAGGWIADYDNFTEPLSDTQFSNFVEAIEGRAQPLDDKVILALAEYKKLDGIIQGEATATGMGLRSSDGSKTIPWVGREKYWPHMYTEEFFSSLRNDPTDIIAQLTKAGKSPQEIQDILSNSKKFGERLVDAQHSREADLPGYRTDRNVYRQHIADMSKRIVEAKNYGPMDLADVDSPLVSLIKESKNPEYASKLMSKLLGRDGIGNLDSIDFSRKVVGAQAWLHLTTAGISNLNSLAVTPMQTTIKSFVGGLADAIFQSKQSGEFAKRSGAIQNIFKEIFAAAMDDTTKFMPTKIYGIDAGERFMRTVSANAGSRYAKELFHEMKDGNASPINLKKLQELTLTNPADLSLQTGLNPQQLKRAAFRVGELSQGLAEMQNLPEHWTGSGIANILTLFHKYQFAQTKIVKDLLTSGSVKQNIRNAGMLLAASQVAGEITGDAKAFVRGTIRTGYSQDETAIYDEIANRGDYGAKKFGLEDSPLLARFIENVFQSFALGIYADLADGFAGGGMDVLRQFAGSTVNDIMKVIDITKDVATGDLEGAGTKATSMIPLVGPPIAAEMREAQ